MRLTIPRMQEISIVVVCVIVGAIWNAPLRGESRRIWTDATGQHHVEAVFIDHNDGNVQLRKPDGTEVDVPIDVLSSADRNYVIAELRRRQIVARRAAEKLQPERAVTEAKPRVSLEAVNTETMFGVNWCKTEEVSIAARAGQNEQKPVMWFRVLGDLSGFM